MSTKVKAVAALDREITETVNKFGFSSDSQEFAKRKIAMAEWLGNFETSELKDALTLAAAVTYVSADDIGRSIQDAAQMLRKLLGEAVGDAHFFQLGYSPAESGGNFLYSLRKALRLNESAFPSASPKGFLQGAGPIVFVDDLIGTGSQAVTFSDLHLKDASAPAFYCSM